MINLTDTHNFISHPETGTAVRAVIVDSILSANPQPTVVQTRFNLRLVFESECAAADGMRYCVWSRPYPYSLHESSLLRRDLKKLLGRDFDPREIEHLDPETPRPSSAAEPTFSSSTPAASAAATSTPASPSCAPIPIPSHPAAATPASRTAQSQTKNYYHPSN